MYNAIDISKWQSTYNAETAKAAGINEVILRCAYGSSKDICFDTFYAAAKAAGQTIGTYGFATWHYSSKNGGNIETARAVMLEQTSVWIDICKDKLDGWFAIDQELESGYSMGLTPSENEILLNECTAMLEAAGFTVCIYCSASWAMAQFNKDNVTADIWVAYYNSNYASADFDAVPDYSTMSGTYFSYMQSLGDQLCGWQYGSTGWGAAYGCGSANLDRNIFYKTAAASISLEPFSTSAVQMKIEFVVDTFETLSSYIGGTLGIICDTSMLGDGYFVTAYATSGDQAGIRTLCATLGISCDVYVAPEVEEPTEDTAPEPEEPTEDVAPEAEELPEAEEPEPEDDFTITPEPVEPEEDEDEAEDNDDTQSNEEQVSALFKMLFKLIEWLYNKLFGA